MLLRLATRGYLVLSIANINIMLFQANNTMWHFHMRCNRLNWPMYLFGRSQATLESRYKTILPSLIQSRKQFPIKISISVVLLCYPCEVNTLTVGKHRDAAYSKVFQERLCTTHVQGCTCTMLNNHPRLCAQKIFRLCTSLRHQLC